MTRKVNAVCSIAGNRVDGGIGRPMMPSASETAEAMQTPAFPVDRATVVSAANQILRPELTAPEAVKEAARRLQVFGASLPGTPIEIALHRRHAIAIINSGILERPYNYFLTYGSNDRFWPEVRTMVDHLDARQQRAAEVTAASGAAPADCADSHAARELQPAMDSGDTDSCCEEWEDEDEGDVAKEMTEAVERNVRPKVSQRTQHDRAQRRKGGDSTASVSDDDAGGIVDGEDLGNVDVGVDDKGEDTPEDAEETGGVKVFSARDAARYSISELDAALVARGCSDTSGTKLDKFFRLCGVCGYCLTSQTAAMSIADLRAKLGAFALRTTGTKKDLQMRLGATRGGPSPRAPTATPWPTLSPKPSAASRTRVSPLYLQYTLH